MQNAESTSNAMEGKKIRTSTIASSRVSPRKPGAMASIIQGVAATPISETTPVSSVKSPATAPATLRASASWPPARRLA